MKNKYFGDVNDYRKYGLLRFLSSNDQFRIGVCWMLTSDDHRPDGKFTDYLSSPKTWRQYDPSLFDLLHECVVINKHRDVSLIEKELPKTLFFSELLSDSLDSRSEYFKQAREKLATCDIIFYDPDNGIERKSIVKGRRNSAKYIYWDEVIGTFQAGHSVLVYQHFPREERDAYIKQLVQDYQGRLNTNRVYWFRTPQVVYFLGVQERHTAIIATQVGLMCKQWDKQIWTGYAQTNSFASRAEPMGPTISL